MAEKKTRVTRSSSPRRTSLSRSTSPDAPNKKNKSSAGDTRTTAKKTPKPKSNIPSDDSEGTNHDLCDACQGPGQFLCCEGCPNVFHFGCVDPPMDLQEVEELEGEWFCNECLHQRKKAKKVSSSAPQLKNGMQDSLFEPMMQNLEARNPVAFSLPEYIRDYFDGVSTGPNGAYVDATTVKAIKYRNGRPEEQDYHRLKDKNGQFIYCYWCYRSSLKKPMISCDFCPLYWHLDCLDPPLTIPPNIAKKWKCPCHAQHHIRYRTPKNSTTTVNDDFLMPQPPSISTSLANEFSKYKGIELPSNTQHMPKNDLVVDENDDNRRNHMQQSDDSFVDFSIADLDKYRFMSKIFGDNFMSSSNKLLTKKERRLKKNGGSSSSSNGSYS